MTKPLDPPRDPRYPLGSGDRLCPDNRPKSEQRSPGDAISSPRHPVPGLFPPSTFIYPARSVENLPRVGPGADELARFDRVNALRRRMDWAGATRKNPYGLRADLAARRRLGR